MNDLLIWKESYSVGVELLDNQHKGLIALINRLSSAPIDRVTMGKVFDELKMYVKEHFAAEEQLLEKVNFKDLVAHKKEHKHFEQWLSAVNQTYGMAATSPELISESVNEFLCGWLINHILSSDMSYKDVVNNNQGPDVSGHGN